MGSAMPGAPDCASPATFSIEASTIGLVPLISMFWLKVTGPGTWVEVADPVIVMIMLVMSAAVIV